MKKLLLYLLLPLGLLQTAGTLLAQPVINYPGNTTANNYTFPAGVAIATQLPANTGTPVGKYGAVVLVKQFTNRQDPYGIATDPTTGNSYVIYSNTTANPPSTNVYQVTSGGTQTALTFAGGNPLTQPGGIAEDSNGNLFISDTQNGQIYKFTVSGTTATLVATIGTNTLGNIYAPQGIGIDASNNLYVADDQNTGATAGIIFKIAAGSTTVTSYQTGLNNPLGIAVDASGNSYVSYGTGTITKITPGGTKSNITGFTNAEFLNPDGQGNIYVADFSGKVYRISSTGTVTAMISTGLSGPFQVSFDSSLTMYIADEPNASRSVFKSAPQYYSYTGTLPTGLLFNITTGAITGTPTVAGGPVSIVVTAYGSASNGTQTVTITIKAVPAISYTGSPYTYYTGAAITSLTPTTTNSPTSFSILPALPTGLNFSTITGVISGTPTVASATNSYTVSATNANGSGTTSISITVYGAPTISYTGSPFSYSLGTPITTLVPTVTNNPTSYTILPNITTNTGLTFNTSTGQISGTPTTASAPVTYTITAINPAGSNFTTISVQVYPTKPTVSYTGPPYTYYTGVAITNLTPTVTNSPTSYTISPSLPAGLNFNTASGVISGTPTVTSAATPYTISAYNANPTPGTTTITITVYTNPTISYTGSPYTYTVGTPITTLTPSVTNNPVSYAILPNLNTNTGLIFNTSTGQISGTPTIVSAAVTYTITATNPAGPGSTTISITCNQPPPTISYIGSPYTYYIGVPITSLTPTATNSPTGYSILPNLTTNTGLSFSTTTGVISGTPTTSSTAVSYTVTATNSGGNGNTSISIKVIGAPALSYAGTPYSYVQGTVTTISITNSGGAPTSTYALTGTLPTGITYSAVTGQFNIAANATVGTYNFTVTAINPAGSSPANISVTINPRAPVVTYATPNTWTAGTLYTLTPNSTGGAVASYAVTSGTLPAGVTLNTGTGVISGTPTAVMATSTIVVTATNVTSTSTPNIVITVNQVSPNISYVTPDVYTVGTVVSLPVTNPNSAVTTSYAITSGTLPAGLTLNTGTGLISGTVTTVTASTTVTITAYTGSSTGVTTVAITVNPLPPNISYTNPAPYVQGTTIANLVPSNSGGPVSTTGTFAPGVVVLKATNGMNKPYGMTADATGNVYVVNFSGNSITEYSTTGTITTTSIAAGGTGPAGVVFDSAGNAYVLFKTSNKVVEYAGGNFAGAGTAIITGLNAPTGIAIDASNVLYIANAGANNILEYSTAGVAGLVITPPNSFFTEIAAVSAGLAVDAAGNIYVSDDNMFDLFAGFFGTSVDVYSATGSFTGFYQRGTNNSGISIDASGNIYLTDTGAGSVTVSTAAFAATLDTETGYNSPQGVVADGLGDYFVSDYNANTVTEYSPVKGYYLTGTLPPGLYFNTTTGTISGRPQTTFALTSYTVSAYNVSGKSTTTFKISCGANPPVIAYTPSVNVYQLNTAIAPLTPALSGGPVAAAGFAAGTTLPGTLSNPWGMTTDASGNIWVVNYGNATVIKYSAAGVVLNTFPVLANPTGVAVDAAGNFYISRSNGRVYKYNSAGALQATSTTIATYGGTSDGIAIDAAGNLYVSDNTDGIIWKIPSGSTTATQLIYQPLGGILQPTGIAVDAAGNIFVVDIGAKALIEYSPLGAYEAKILTGLNTPYGLYIDTNGDYYVGDPGAGTVKEYNEGGTLLSTIPAPTANPRGLTVGASGNLYVSDYTAGTVKKYVPFYYSISPALPAGLAFNTITGSITGTPTTVFGPTVFTVTIDGADGNGSTTVTLSCATAPVFSYASPQTYTVGNAIATLSATLTSGGPVTGYSTTGLPPGLSLNTTTGDITGTPTTASPATNYTVTATNGYGFSNSTTINITCVNPPVPVITYTTPHVYTINIAITPLTPTGTGGPVQATGGYSAPTLPTGLSIDPNTGIISGTPTVISPPTNYPVTAANSGGTSVAFNVNIACVPPPPSITYTTPDLFNTGAAITPLTPTSTGGPVVSYTISPALPAGLIINSVTGVISGTPTVVTAPVNYTVTAINTGGTGTFVINITCNGSAPAFTYTTPDTYPIGTPIAPLVPTNTGGPPVSYSVSTALPAGLTLNTGTGAITGTPTAVTAAANYTITATNPGGSSTFTINIACAPGSPVFTYTTPNVFPVGVAVTPLGPTNTGTAPTSYSIGTALPAGLTFNTTTGVISGTPTTASPAATYIVTGTEASGNTGTFTVSVACSNGNDWVGTTSNDWNIPGNWSAGTVPTATDVANIGVNVPFTNFPTVLTGESPGVGSVVIGTNGGQAGGIMVNTGAALAVSGTISYQSDANAGAYTAALSGAGAITAGGINVTANTTLGTPAAYTETLTSSITSLILTSNVTLTSTVDGSSNALNAAFSVTSGTVSVGGAVQTSNGAGSTSALSVANATLQLAGAAPLSGLSGTGTNTVSFNNTGATIEYSGAMQTFYTNAAITGLPAGVSYNSIKFSGSGLKSPNGTATNTLNIPGDFTNALTLNDGADYIDLSKPIVNFTGVTQNIYAGNGTGTTFYIINFNGTGTTTIQNGSAYLASKGVLTMGGGSSTLAANGNLTLKSTVNGTATVAAIPTGCSVTGLVNVQRYLTGGASLYRGYRLLSSSVASSQGGSVYSLNYVKNSSYITGTTAAAGGFDAGGNPTLYLFRENLVPNNNSFTSGNYRGINNITTAPNYNMDVDNGPFNIPVGNGFLFFFRGDRAQAPFATESTVSYIPTGTTMTETGYLNQGAIPVNSWYTPNGAGLIYSTISGKPGIEGFNLVGNPYPSSIDWDTYSTTTSTAGVYAPNAGPFIYVMNNRSGNNFNVYQAGMGGAGTIAGTGSNVIPGGQGFFVVAHVNNSTMTFNEIGKTNAQATAAQGNLFMGKPVAAAVPQYLRMTLVQDSLHFDGSIINFNSSASENYVVNEDAPYRRGSGSVGLSSYSADNIKLAINNQPLPNQVQKNIPLSVLVSADGQYSINLDAVKAVPALYDIWLKDAFNKDSLDIKNNPTYVFNATFADTTTYSNRFSLVIRQDPALMVHLLNFNASKITGGDQVVWTTENEQNYTNFTVQRSTDGGATFNVLEGLTSSAQGTYSYLDNAPANGANSYRLKMTDLNGTVTYSKIVTIMYANTNNQIATNGMLVYPNPTVGVVNLSITSNQAVTTGATTNLKPAYSIEIVNNLGAVIKSATSTSTNWQTDVSGLKPGTYFIQVTDTNQHKVVGKSAFVRL